MALTDYDFDELESPRYEINQEGMTATRRLYLHNWSDVDDFLDELAGQQHMAGNGVLYITIPTFPGKDYLILDSASIEQFHGVSSNDSQGLATGKNGALVTLTYKTKKFNQDESEDDDDQPSDTSVFQTHNINARTQIMTMPHGALKWENADADNNPTVDQDIAPGFPFTIIDHDLTWHNVPIPNFQGLNSLVGKVNDAQFFGHNAETVLFNHYSGTRQTNTDGTRKWEMQLKFSARIIPGFPKAGWNHFYQPNAAGGAATWVRIVNADDGAKILPTADFNTIFNLNANN